MFSAPAEAEPNPPADVEQALEFFDKHVRPVFAAHCYSCHGEKKQEGGLRLDSQAALLRGSDNGQVISPGDPEGSRLVAAIRYQDQTLQMPPDGQLAEEDVQNIAHWIAVGAPWPAKAAPEHSRPDPRLHWAFQPLTRPDIPEVSGKTWPATGVDYFILARLDQAGLAPSPPANRSALIRRMTYDVTGLPPSPAEVSNFVNDPRADAIERLVDRLLASPAYGQRWGRHWLDVARYADNKGYKFFGSDDFYAYTYRDWVVRAMNSDLPYDQFVVAQLAADQFGLADDTRDLAAMGFLTVGRRFLEDIHDIIDDRIDVVSRGLMGLSVTCARCHDHKFDPIPTADYYSLYGVFAASWERTRTIAAPGLHSDEQRKFAAELDRLEGELDSYFERRHSELLASYRTRVGEYLLAAHAQRNLPPTDKFMFVEEPDKLSQYVIGNWRAYLERTQKTHDPIFAPWHAFADLNPEQFSAGAAELAARFASNHDPAQPINEHVAAMFSDPPSDLADVANRYSQLFATVEAQWRERIAVARATDPQAYPPAFDDRPLEELRQVLYGSQAPMLVMLADVEFLIGRPGQAEVAELRKKIAEHMQSTSVRVGRAMVLEDAPPAMQFNPRIFVRGKPSNLGAEVPRRFIELLSSPERPPFTHGSGRAELARAIVDPGNPLTPRVLVNRVWQHYFGTALVRTPSDFGLRSEGASHPELLDWLARQLIEGGWSLKKLHRSILLSSTYAQASDAHPEGTRIDPDNRLVWRMNRRRLDLEAMRDALLSVSGQLDRRAGGPPDTLQGLRRTVYAFVDRQNLPGLLRTFDFAVPDAHSPQRFTTTVPQQALFLMNNSFVIERARGLVRRPEISSLSDPNSRIEALHQILYARPATGDEIDLGIAFIESRRQSPPGTLDWQYGYGEYDESAGRVNGFTRLSHWTGQRWQGGPNLPDAQTGWVYLDATGGHPGERPGFAAIRRWTAPRGGVISIQGTLRHAVANGDGIDAYVASGRVGQLGHWTVHNGQATTAIEGLRVEAGDTIDFVVCRRESLTDDQHLWAPLVRLVEDTKPGTVAGSPDDSSHEWDANRDFAGPRLDAWEQYAQALMMANEFVFVD